MDDSNDIIGLANDIFDIIKKRETPPTTAILAVKSVEVVMLETMIRNIMKEVDIEKRGLPGVN